LSEEEDWSDADEDAEECDGEEDDDGEEKNCCSDDECDSADCGASASENSAPAAADGEGLPEVDEATARQQLNTIIEDVGLERLIPPLDGTAFYSLICKINHSCEPNVIVKYDPAAETAVLPETVFANTSVGQSTGSARGLVGSLHVLRDITPG
jgi:phosphosulfolactate synthase (CoM biosynthesis protein A)